jgi:F-type H+-transporting ATPase subunit delta
MPNPRLAGRYAKSLIDLAIEKNQLETVYADMQYLLAVCKQSREFVNLMRSPIISSDKKAAIIKSITSGKISSLTEAFNQLLINKGREADLPEIVSGVIDLYNEIKGIHKVKLTTAVAISEEAKKAIADKVSKEANLGKVELETKVNENLIGGFMLEFNNNLVDASILRDLRDVKKQFSKNTYVKSIR